METLAEEDVGGEGSKHGWVSALYLLIAEGSGQRCPE
jgi:hypothetical protein